MKVDAGELLETFRRYLRDHSLPATHQRLAVAEALFETGEQHTRFFVVIEGQVEISQDGRRFPPRGGSDFFGEISLVSRSPTTATVETVTPTRALVIAPQQFRALLDRTPSIQRRILHSFSERLAPHVI